MRSVSETIDIPAGADQHRKMASELSRTGPAPVAVADLRRLALAFFCVHCCVVSYTTLLPFQFTLDRLRRMPQPAAELLQPQRPPMAADFVGNILLFVPVGAFALLMQRRPERHTVVQVALAESYGLLLSLGVELLQWLTPSRDPAVSDIWSNALGTLLGAAAAAVVASTRSASRWVGRLSTWMRCEPLVMAVLGLVALTGVWALAPFDVSLQPHVLSRSLRILRLQHFWNGVAFVDVTQWLFFALLAGLGIHLANGLRPTQKLRNLCVLLAAVGSWALALELLQLLLKSKAATLLDVLTALAGGVAGILVALATTRVRRPDHQRHLGMLAYVAGLLLLALRPLGTGFGVEVIQRRLAVCLPGYVAHFDATLAGVTRFVHGALLFVPLGYWLAAGPRRLGLLRRPLSCLPALLACGLVAVLMNLTMTLVTPQGAPWLSGVFAACLGGSLGASVRGQLEWMRDGVAGRSRLEQGLLGSMRQLR